MIALDDSYLGWRVEAVDSFGEKRRFYVSKSMGRIPVFLELKTRRSLGGYAACYEYQSITRLYRRDE